MQALTESFEKLFHEHAHDVRRLITQHTRNADDALDLTQEVFIRAYNAFARFRGDCSASTWLHRITLNVCANASRSNSRHNECSMSDMEPCRCPEDWRDVVDELARAEDQKILRRALSSLSAEQLVVLSLRFSDQLTVHEIAEVTRTPVDTVKSRLRSALVKIHSALSYMRMADSGDRSVVEGRLGIRLDQFTVEGEEGAQVYHNLGTLYLKKGLIEAAMKEWGRAQAAEPTFLDAYLASAHQYVSMDQPQRAVETLETAVSRVNSGTLHITLGQLHLRLGDVDDGMRHCLRAVKLEPDNPNAHYAAGWAYDEMADTHEALLMPSGEYSDVFWADLRKSTRYLGKAIRLKPDFARARAQLAWGFVRRGMPEKALREAKTAARTSSDAFVLHQVAQVHMHSAQPVAAERYIRESISIEATPAKLSLLGYNYQTHGRYADAQRTYNEALSLVMDKKHRAHISTNIAACALGLDLFDEVIEAGERALELDPDQVHARCNLASAYLQRGDDPKIVIRLCSDGLRIRPDHKCLYPSLAEAYFRQGQLDEALIEANTGVNIDSDKCARWVLRAKILAKMGRIDEAKSDLAKACEIEPENADALSILREIDESCSPPAAEKEKDSLSVV